jgi:replication-associated recombination protein RarA
VAPDSDKKSERAISARATPDDIPVERALRPRVFSEYVGQAKITDNLKVFVEAAKQREEALDHVLFCGPPGLGKTTLAYVITNELDVNLVSTSGPAIRLHRGRRPLGPQPQAQAGSVHPGGCHYPDRPAFLAHA